jgi:hypothetical protein
MVRLVERLDEDNERLRLKVLELLRRTERAVDAHVEAEHRLEAVRARTVTARLRTAGERLRRSLARDRASVEAVTQYPVFVTVRDRLTPLRQLVQWLERAGQRELYLIDNASTYPPLVEYLDVSPHRVIRADENLGHRAPWLTGSVQRLAAGRFFVVSDPDVVPDEGCPLDALERFRELLERHPSIDKVGFGLRIDDLDDAYPLSAAVRQWESRFWRDEVEPGVYRADIDTTFALYRPLDRRHDEGAALRTGPPYVARHLPWYVSEPGEEDLYYRQHADPTTSNWDRDELPRWKERWLSGQSAVTP